MMVYLIPTIILLWVQHFQNVGWSVALFLLYSFSGLSFTFFWSSFFSSAKLSGEVFSTISGLTDFLYILVYWDSFNKFTSLVWLICIFPQTALQVGMTTIGWSDPYPRDNFKVEDAALMLFLTSVVYYLFYLYFDAVIFTFALHF